ncbi:hypothetical protein AJ80_05121 [Polytolypa hystricis UAMH7299]|uniref:Extracellular mutant protein 11 C-terminal domain-containing protein n=1 Tax=Polytolypa hystricis (strain UAMH7299) TaxID=1447883 RepID=A0A2B7Y684_POLH7|nr:hypothetical protein AJ80_05121 [Polytolypa hystricis UAMH7299]
MAVGDYIRGRTAQNAPRASQGPGEQGVRQSRQQFAEMARVAVPVTRLNGTSDPTSQGRVNHFQGSGEGLADPTHTQTAPRDMFDTDVEGIDDSTTTASLMQGEMDNGVFIQEEQEQQQPPAQFHDFNNNAVPSLEFGGYHNHIGANGNQQTLAERLLMELGSDPEDEERGNQQHMPAEHMQDSSADAEDEADHYGDETQILNWSDNNNNANADEPLSWQRIEEALRENTTQPRQDVPPPPHFPAPAAPVVDPRQIYEEREEEPQQTTIFNQPGMDNNHHILHTPRKLPKFNIGRFGPTSRFSTPKPPPQQIPRPVTAKKIIPLIGSREISRPASAHGVPMSPVSASKPIVRMGSEPNQHQNNTMPSNEQYTQPGGVFDVTDLSALDSSESSSSTSNGNQGTYTSVRLSTLSPLSASKRPRTTAFASDYPPNILFSKSFSDLRSESFDYTPAPPQPIFPPQDPPLPLSEKLQRLKSLTDDQRRNFFSSLSIDEWEDSGDWLLEQFATLLTKTKEARHERRSVARVFEKEVERRYEAVEGEGKEIEKRLEDMRAGGMGVLKGHNS